MRNLKRALSLALASVMLLGMMVVGAGAASYPDVDENDNVEAIEVLNAVNVMIGRQGNFEPDEAVNRHEMAVIMAKLVLGVDTADNYVGSHPFTDVVPWADKYVAACYENGLVAGTSATTYGGGNPLTAVQAAAMMLRALGYKDLNKDYQGDWRAPITAMANQIRLFNGVASNPNEKLNRNQVAQLALNTLKSPMVNLKDGTFTATDGNGQLIISGGSREYIALSSNEAYAKAINSTEKAGTSASQIEGYTVELGEHLYNGKLKLNSRDTDVFGRPTRTWEYDGKKIGSYIKEELMVKNDVGTVTGVDLYNLLGSSTIKDYDLDVYVDGINDPAVFAGIPHATQDGSNTNVVFNKTDLNRNNKAAIGKTGTGVLMQVFVDPDEGNNGKIWVAVINTYLAIADKAYDEKKEEASLQVYAIDKDNDNNYGKVVTATFPTTKPAENKETFKLGNEDFDLVKDIKKDDPYLVTVADGAIQTIVPAEVLTGSTITAFKKADHVVSGGTTYKYASAAGYNYDDLYIYTSEADSISNLKDITYNIYLDGYGNLIGLKADSSPKNYVFLTSIDRNGSYVSNRTATANALFPDGTFDTISINMTKSEWRPDNRPAGGTGDENFEFADGGSLLNTWCTYTKSGDVYTVKEVWNNENPNTPGEDLDRAPKTSSTKTTGNLTNLAQFRSFVGITTDDSITLKDGLRLRTSYPIGNSFANVYGDSDSAYLTVELGRVTNGSGTSAKTFGIINDVESVFKGIDGTDITVWTGANALTEANKNAKANTNKVVNVADVSHGVYTLYDKEGIVIASVIVGEGSAAKDLVYVTSSDLSLEEDNGGAAKAAGDGKWTFHREVVRNGEKVMLTEVGESVDALSSTNMKQHAWYQVKTDGNGNVTSAIPAFQALDDYDVVHAKVIADPANNSYGKDIFVDNYTNINDAVEEDSINTVLYHTNAGPNADEKGREPGAPYAYSHRGFSGTTKLEVKGNNVLAVDTLDGSGIYFRSNVNVVLTYWNRNKNQTEVIIDTGVDAVKDAVDFVNDNTTKCKTKNGDAVGRLNNGKEDFFVSALIQNGAATTIVIHDRYNDYSRPEDNTQYDQKLYLAGILGNNYYLSSNTEVYTVDADGRHAVPVDKDWNDWRNNVVRYSVKSGDNIAIYDPDIATYAAPGYYPDFDSKVTITAADWDITGNWLTFTMPRADVTIRDGVAPAGISTAVDLTGAKVGPGGAEITYNVYDDESATLAGMTPKAEKVKVATMTVTLDKDGKVIDVKIVPVSAASEKVIKVTITTGAKKAEVAITNNAAQPKDVAVEAPAYVAKATTDADGKITKIEYNDDKLEPGKTLPIVDEKGDTVTGTVAKAADNTVSVKDAAIADDATITDGETPKDLNTDGTVGEEVETFDVTITPNDKVTVTSEPATLTGLKSGTKVTLTVAVKDAAAEEIKSVKAGNTTLTKNAAGKYEFTVTADVTVTVETQAKGGTNPPSTEKEIPGVSKNPATGAVEIAWYDPAGTAINDVSATNLVKAKGAGFYPGKTIDVVTVSGTAATIKFVGETATETATIVTYHKITVDGASKFVKSSGTEDFTGLEWNVFIEETYEGGATSSGKTLSGTGGKVTVTGSQFTKDATFIRAALVAAPSTGNSMKFTRTSTKVTTPAQVTATQTALASAETYLPIGEKLTVEIAADSATAGQTIVVAKESNQIKSKEAFRHTLTADEVTATKFKAELTIAQGDVAKADGKIMFTTSVIAKTLDLGNGVTASLSSTQAGSLNNLTGVAVTGSNIKEGYYVPTGGTVGMQATKYVTVTKQSNGTYTLAGALDGLDSSPNLWNNNTLKLLPAAKLVIDTSDNAGKYDGDKIVAAYGEVTGDVTATALYTSIDGVTIKAKLDTDNAATSKPAYKVGANGAVKELSAETVNLSDLTAGLTGAIDITFTVISNKVTPAVKTDTAKLTAVNDDQTDVKGTRKGYTDPTLVAKQDMTIDGNTIKIVSGFTDAQFKDAASGSGKDDGKIMGLTYSSWNFDAKYTRFIVLAFEAPEGVAADVVPTVTITNPVTGVRGPSTGADCRIGNVAYMLFSYWPGAGTRVLTVTWSGVVCSYTVEIPAN